MSLKFKLCYLLRITEVRDGLQRQGADDGDQGEEARGQEDHPGVPGQQEDVPTSVVFEYSVFTFLSTTS